LNLGACQADDLALRASARRAAAADSDDFPGRNGIATFIVELNRKREKTMESKEAAQPIHSD
jgi:hypothetical protein